MLFESALSALRDDYKIHRRGWNGVGLRVHLQRPDAQSKMTSPYAYLEYSDGQRVPWAPSQTDLFADDWVIAS